MDLNTINTHQRTHFLLFWAYGDSEHARIPYTHDSIKLNRVVFIIMCTYGMHLFHISAIQTEVVIFYYYEHKWAGLHVFHASAIQRNRKLSFR